MKKLYLNPNRFVDQYFSQIQNLKAQHLRLIESLQRDLNIDVPAKLLAALQPQTMAGQPPDMVAEFVPYQMQPRFFRGGPGIGPQIPMGPPPEIQDAIQAARERGKQMQRDMRKRMRGMMRRRTSLIRPASGELRRSRGFGRPAQPRPSSECRAAERPHSSLRA